MSASAGPVPLVVVAAVAGNGVIGDGNRLIWRLKTDLRHFRALTIGRPVLMGRKTFLSIGKPLPGRETVVLTRDRGFVAAGAHIARSLDQALALGQGLAAAMGSDSVVSAGGAEIYAQTLDLAERLELTLVDTEPQGDAVFPAFDRADFVETARETHPASPDDEHAFSFVSYRRRG